MAQVTIDVNQTYIMEGQKLDCWSCPIALAASKALGRVVQASADHLMFGSFYDTWVPLPQVVRDWIERYDKGEMVHPFSFVVEVP